jgi:adenine-specific DNA-methyltransferase
MPKPAPTDTKLRGGFYTPPELTRVLSDWAIQSRSARILEPSCGDGAFFPAIKESLELHGDSSSAEVFGAEWNREEAVAASGRMAALGLAGTVVPGDFFQLMGSILGRRKFDAVVGNPPFLRFQYFPEEQRDLAFALMRTLGMRPNRLTNAWVPFVAVAASLLTEGGRLAMVVPAELLQVTYAAELRRYLATSFRRITLVTFNELVFDEVEQEVVLLLGERCSDGPQGIRVLELDGLRDLDTADLKDAKAGLPLDHTNDKWTQYFLSQEQFDLSKSIRESTHIARLGDIGHVDVGVVTGNNDFFVIDPDSIWSHQLADYLVPTIHRSSQLKGLSLGEEDWLTGAKPRGGRKLLAVSVDQVQSESLREYIELGEQAGVHTGYKCRIRKQWHVVPSTGRPDAFMLRQIYESPRLSLNAIQATSTDTVHRVRLKANVDGRRLAASFHSSLTFAFAELFGRSYGGGVLELEPTEAERLPVAYSKAAEGSYGRVDSLLRAGVIPAAAQETDKLIHRELGLAVESMELLNSIWIRLRDRRLGRGRPSAPRLAKTA